LIAVQSCITSRRIRTKPRGARPWKEFEVRFVPIIRSKFMTVIQQSSEYKMNSAHVSALQTYNHNNGILLYFGLFNIAFVLQCDDTFLRE